MIKAVRVSTEINGRTAIIDGIYHKSRQTRYQPEDRGFDVVMAVWEDDQEEVDPVLLNDEELFRVAEQATNSGDDRDWDDVREAREDKRCFK